MDDQRRSLCLSNMEKRNKINAKLYKCIKLREDESFHYVGRDLASRLNYMLNFDRLPEEFMNHVKKEYIEGYMNFHLTQAKAINYLPSLNPLYPFKTSG